MSRVSQKILEQRSSFDTWFGQGRKGTGDLRVRTEPGVRSRGGGSEYGRDVVSRDRGVESSARVRMPDGAPVLGWVRYGRLGLGKSV